MSWNYRVICGDGETLAIHEVYYDQDGVPARWTARPVGVMSETPEGLSDALAQMANALTKPILHLVGDNLIEAPKLASQKLGDLGGTCPDLEPPPRR